MGRAGFNRKTALATLTMVLAWLLLGEKLTGSTIAGGLLITAGAVVVALG